MSFKILQGVSYDGGPPGQAFGGGIYSVSCDIGTAVEPTKITLNIISENGSYAIGTNALNVTSSGAKTITLGTGSNTITFNHMYVYKFNYNQTASAKTLTVTLIDHSVAFDKIFVGLVGRHSVDPNLVVPNVATFPFTVNCTECNTLWPRMVSVGPAAVSKVVWSAKNTGSYKVQGPGGIDGGYIIMGWEQWTDGNCEIPKVEYTFSELLTTLDAIGYDVTSLWAFNRSAVYLASYSGSLREVLNAWASDFSFSFIIDPLNPTLTIIGTDLTAAVDLTQVRQSLSPVMGVGDFNSDSAGAMIRSRSDTYTLENTYRQEPIVKNIKGAKTFTRKQINYTAMTGKPVSVTDAIGPWGHLGRNDAQFMISIALAKYKPEARMMWLSDQCAQAGVQGTAWPSLGFIPADANSAGGAQGVYGVTGPTLALERSRKDQLLKLFKQDDANSTFLHPIWSDPDNYWIYIGVWNESYQSAMESFDSELADFYNKWAYWYGCPWNEIYKTFDCTNGMMMTNPPASFRECPLFADGNKYYDYAAEIKTLPESKFYQKGAYPFQDILRANAGAFAYTQNMQPIVDASRMDGDALFELADNAWGTHVEHMENLFANKWVLDQGNANNWDPSLAPQSSLDHFLPIYARFDANQILDAELRNILPAFKYDFLKSSARQDGYFPGIAIIPKMHKAKLRDPTTGLTRDVLEVGQSRPITANRWIAGVDFNPMIIQTNGVAYDNVRRRRLEQIGDNAKDCTIYCEEDIVSNLCECPAIVDPLHKWPFDPMTGVNHFLADAFQIGHLGSYKTIIFPVGADYIGYWKSDVTLRGTYPKEIDVWGEPAYPAGNVMESKVVDVDVTQEVNPPEMGVGTEFVVLGNPAPVSFATYAAAVSTMNQQSLFPGETITVKVDGIEFQGLVLRGLLHPQKGLTNFSISMDESGMSTDLTYSSRVPKMPKRDVWMQQIGPRATQGRTGGAIAGQSMGSGNPRTNAVGAFPW